MRGGIHWFPSPPSICRHDDVRILPDCGKWIGARGPVSSIFLVATSNLSHHAEREGYSDEEIIMRQLHDFVHGVAAACDGVGE